MSRIGDQRSPFGVTPPKAGNRSRFRLKLGTMRRIGGIRRANFLEWRSGPRRLRGGTIRREPHEDQQFDIDCDSVPMEEVNKEP